MTYTPISADHDCKKHGCRSWTHETIAEHMGTAMTLEMLMDKWPAGMRILEVVNEHSDCLKDLGAKLHHHGLRSVTTDRFEAHVQVNEAGINATVLTREA